MSLSLPTRTFGSAAVLLVLLVPSCAHAFGPRPRAVQRAGARAEIRAERTPPSVSRSPATIATPIPQREGHLEKWIENHRSLSPEDQHRALQNEPGFRLLDPTTQQRQLNQLDRLNSMSPQQRIRMLNGVEGLERLSPQQQQSWDHAVQQLHSIEPQRRSVMIHTIADLRAMPANQRQQVIDSPAFANQFSPDERETIRTVLTAY